MADQNPRLAEITEQVNYELEKFGHLTGRTADSLRDATVGVVGFSAAMRNAPTQVVDAAGKMAKAMYDGQKGASAFNSSIDSMAGAAQSATTMLMAIIPGGVVVKVALMALGKAIGVAADALKQVNIQGDALYKGFQDLAKSGSVAAGGTTQLGQDIYKLGIGFQDLDKYVGLVNESSQDLALFGRTVYQGQSEFANLRQTMKPMRAEFERLGLNAEQQNEAVMGYIRLQTRLGNASRVQEQGYAATAEAARKYIMEQDALTKVTGITRKEQEKAMEEAMRNQRFAATIDQLISEGRTEEAENLRVMVQASGQLGPQFQKGMTDLASGFVNTEEARQVLLATQGEALTQVDRVKQGLIKAPEEIDRAQQSMIDNVAEFNKNMRPLAQAGAYDKTFGPYAEQRKAQELKDGKYAAGMVAARKQRDGQAAGIDKRLAAQSNTIVNQNTAQIETQRAADVAITSAAKASEAASEQLAKLATAAANAATSLGDVKNGASGFWTSILNYFGLNTQQREATAEEADAQKNQQEKKDLSDKAEADRKSAEAALKAEQQKVDTAKKEIEAAKQTAIQSAAVADVRGREAQAAEAKAKEVEAKAAELEKNNDAKAAEARKEADAARKRAEDLRRYEADYRQRAEAAKLKEKQILEAAEAAKQKLATGELQKNVETAKATEKTAARESMVSQVQASGMSKSDRLTPQQIVERESAIRANAKDTAALEKINQQLNKQQEELKANTAQLSKLDKTKDKATIALLERSNQVITNRTQELEKEAKVLKEKIEKNKPKPAPSAPRPPGGTAPGGTAPGGTAPGGTAPGGTSTAAPATVPVGPTTAPAGGGGGAAPGGAAPGGAAGGEAAPGGAAPGGAAPGGANADQLVQMGNEIRIGNQIRKGGTISWRTNNPGNVSYGDLAKKFGAIGTWKNPQGDQQQRTTGIAIMPTEEAGINLKKALWRRPMYLDKTIDAAVQKWTGTQPPGSNYAKDMAAAANATLNTIVSTLSDRQLQSMVVKQREWEGYKPGQVVSAADGGMFSGPKSGYPATLHGTEAVIPLKNGEVPVNIDNKDADQLQMDVRKLTANVIRLTQKDVMAPGGIGPTMGGHNEYTGYNAGPMTTDIAMLEKIAGKLGAYDKATQTITDPKLWKEILKSGMMMNYDFGMTQVGTKDLSSRAGSEAVADAIAGRIKELINNRQDSTEAIAQTRTELADMMKTFYTDVFAKLQDELRKENPLDSEMLAVLKDISQTNAAAAGSSEKMLRHARN